MKTKTPSALEELTRLNKDIRDTEHCIRVLQHYGLDQTEIDGQKAFLRKIQRERDYVESLVIKPK